MYYEEKIINGKLCWRGTTDGEWVEYSQEQVVKMLEEARREIMELWATDA